MDYTSLVLSQCSNISWKIPDARMMKDHCRQLGQRINTVEDVVHALQSRTDHLTSQVGRALQKLYSALMEADSLVQRCSVNRTVNKTKYKNEFSAIDQRIQDSLRVLTTVPHSSRHRPASHTPYADHTPSPSHVVPTSHALPIGYSPSLSHVVPTSHAPSPRRRIPASHAPRAIRAPQMYCVEEVDDDLDEAFEVVMSPTRRGGAGPRVQGRQVQQALLMMDDGTMMFSEFY